MLNKEKESEDRGILLALSVGCAIGIAKEQLEELRLNLDIDYTNVRREHDFTEYDLTNLYDLGIINKDKYEKLKKT